MGTLYVVATPIGNLEDITLRALRVLREVDIVVAEDTRVTKKLLAAYDVKTRLLSYNRHNRHTRIPRLIEALREGDVALTTDAGTPVVSDPGAELVQAAVSAGYLVTPIPGSSAVTASLSVAGMVVQEFTFLGFLPRGAGRRRKALAHIALGRLSLVIYEAPHRLRQTFTDLHSAFGDRRIVVCRELTKRFEEIFRGGILEALSHFSEPRGEFTLIVEGRSQTEETALTNAQQLRVLMADLRAQGVSPRKAVSDVMLEFGISRKAAYAAWVEGGKRVVS